MEELQQPEFELSREGLTCTRYFYLSDSDKLVALNQAYFPKALVSGAGLFIAADTVTYPNDDWSILVLDKIKATPFLDKEKQRFSANGVARSGTGLLIVMNYKTKSFPQTGQPVNNTPSQGSPGPSGNKPSDPQTLFTWHVKLGGTFLTREGGGLKWVNHDLTLDPVTASVRPACMVPTTDLTITWHRVYSPPWGAIRRCRGAVNNSIYMGANPGTLLYTGADGDQDATTDSLKPWKLNQMFSETSPGLDVNGLIAGWNHFMRPDGPNAGKYHLLIDGNANHMYQSQEFANLFQPGGQ